MNYTKLLPNWVDIVINYNKVDPSIMKDCNKTAVLLPDFEAHAFYYNLKREGKSAFLGDDLKMYVAHGIQFFRRTNPQVLKRLNSLHSAGLWDWWTKMLVDVIPRIQGGFIGDNIPPWKASNLDGYIVIVFVIYGTGILTAILAWILEFKIVVRIGVYLGKLLKTCYQILIKILTCNAFKQYDRSR